MEKSLPARRLSRRVATPLIPLALVLSFQATGNARDFNQRIYLGGNLGISQLKPRTADTGFHVDDDTGTGGSVTAGYDLAKRLSIEGFFSRLGAAGISADSTSKHAGDIDYDYGGISAIGYLYNNRGQSDSPDHGDDEGYYRREGLSFYARVGAGKLNTTSSTLIHRQRKNWDLHLGAGIEYGWSNGFAARAEFISFDKDAKFITIGLVKRFGGQQSRVPRAVPAPLAPVPVEAAIKAVPPKPAIPLTKPKSNAPEIELPRVYFGYNRSDLSPEAQSKLDTVARTLKQQTRLKLQVSGHTDAIGSEKYNERLGLKRAESAAHYLIDKGVESNRLAPVTFGEHKPVADNATKTGRQLNRRVEFEIK